MIQEDKQYFTKFISPANPIITKAIIDEPLLLKLEHPPPFRTQQVANLHNRFQGQDISDEEIEGRLTLFNAYQPSCLVFRKWDNTKYRRRGRKEYFASIFGAPGQWPEQEKVHYDRQGIRFSSGEDSMNLFAAYQVGPWEYDLILQNDANTSGYTQWFHFTVHNPHKNTKVKLNIVNLYKTRSLYSQGMKPVAQSLKGGRGWQRAGTAISYSQNQINFEYSSRSYYTLSFQHTFLSEKDSTTFAHCFPYTFNSHLREKIKQLEKNSRVHIRTIGQTCLKKGIPMIEFSQEDSNPTKKAIVIMARQHPGETLGSYIMDQILSELSSSSTQADFLLWRFNIYCIPIVNIDGVQLGNYRGNAFGFDLNRSWDRQNSAKLPEICCIKKEIKRIQKKFPIELMLDLHGHSRKMGSFFYGNPFGKNTGLFPYVASKTSPCISFQNSTFNKEKSDKISTARIVLGNIIKDTGSFYTYETSFFGSNLNGKKTHFTIEALKDLGKNLISAAAKTFLEIQKEEKSLKESIFLKQVRKQITKIKEGSEDCQSSGSDSEAEILTATQMKIKNQEILDESAEKLRKSFHQKKFAEVKKNQSVEIQVGNDNFLFEEDKNEKVEEVEAANRSPFRRNNIKLRLANSSEKYGLQVGFQKNDMHQKREEYGTDPLKRKHFLMQKLRIFGETFIEQHPRDKNKETQTSGDTLNILGKNQFGSLSREESPVKSTQYRKKRNRNKSLILRVDHKDKLAMADIVKVNRLEYKKIKRESLNQLALRPRIKYEALPLIN